MQTLGVAGTPRHPWSHRTRRRGVRFRRLPNIPCSQTQAADENGKAEVRRLTELSVEQGKKAGGVEQEWEDVAALQFAETEKPEAEREQRSPEKERRSEDRSALQNHAAPFAFSEKKNRAT